MLFIKTVTDNKISPIWHFKNQNSHPQFREGEGGVEFVPLFIQGLDKIIYYHEVLKCPTFLCLLPKKV